ncbi:MAG: dUTP diphosphatase [Thermodesulfobacteriota bacterium]
MTNQIDVDIQFLHDLWQDFPLAYATSEAVGLDLRACITEAVLDFTPGQRQAVPAGIALQINEPGYAGFVFSRSGLGTKKGLVVSQGVGVIDPDYRGEVIVSLLNTSSQNQTIERGERVAQLLFMPAAQAHLRHVDSLHATPRGSGGFGHSGRW